MQASIDDPPDSDLAVGWCSARQDRGRPDSETSVFAVVILILNYIIIVVPVFKLLVGNVENFSTTGRKLCVPSVCLVPAGALSKPG